MATIGGGKKRRSGALRDLEPNYIDTPRGDAPPTKNCYLLGRLARADPQGVWRSNHEKCVRAGKASRASNAVGNAGIVGGYMAPGMSAKRRTAIHYIFTHVLGSP